MEDGLLSLKWNNHKSTFFHILSNLRKKETYTDATLACDGKFFPVHKLVMSTCSDYFSEVFERTTCKSPVVILKDIRHHDLEALLDYMYLGEVDVKQSELAALIKAAECLRIKGLAVPDEDPTLSHKKTTHVPESRASPSGKRSRRESGEAESNHHFTSHHKVRRSLSPPSTSSSRSHSSLAPTSVPSQSGISDAQPQVPSHGMPPPVYSDSRSSMPDFSSNDAQKHQDQSLVPVDMIKVEVEEGSSNPPLRQRDSLPEQGERRKNSLTEGAIGTDSGGGSGGREKEPISNNFSEYTNHPTEIEKEEHDQLDTYNGSEQVPGPSGVQGGSQMMNWGEEEGNFPHNLFGGEDSSHQQVTWHGEEGLKPIQNHAYQLPAAKPVNALPSLGDPVFEGFEEDHMRVSHLKKLIMDSSTNKYSIKENSLDSNEANRLPPEADGDFSFEMIVKEFENELSCIPYEVCFNEKEAEFIPSTINSRLGTKYLCYDCGFSFKSKRLLEKHMNNSDACTYSCPVCPYKGKDVAKHVSFHAEYLDDILLCVMCRAPVNDLDHLVAHLKLNHTY